MFFLSLYITEEINTEEFIPHASSTPTRKRTNFSPLKGEPAAKRSNLSGKDCRKRKENFCAVLKETFVESPGRTTSYAEVMETIETDNKSMATRAVKEAFPTVRPDSCKCEYKNIRWSISFEKTSASSTSLEVCHDSNIHRLQQEVAIHKDKA